jgi:hypothetical protein
MIVLYRSTLLPGDTGDFLPMTQYKSFTFKSVFFLGGGLFAVSTLVWSPNVGHGTSQLAIVELLYYLRSIRPDSCVRPRLPPYSSCTKSPVCVPLFWRAKESTKVRVLCCCSIPCNGVLLHARPTPMLEDNSLSPIHNRSFRIRRTYVLCATQCAFFWAIEYDRHWSANFSANFCGQRAVAWSARRIPRSR